MENERRAPSLGQNFLFGFDGISAQERMRAIKDAGFDDVMIWWGGCEFEQEQYAPETLFDLSMRVSLRVRTAHFPTEHTPALWQDSDDGDAYERQLMRAIDDCAVRGIQNLVVHTTKALITPPPCETGALRIRRACERAERAGINIALENTRFLDYNQYLYDRVLSKRLTFCFDSGHAHCFTPGQDPLARFGSRLSTMHLHDNNGPSAGDEHRLPGEGGVDFADIGARLAALRPEAYNLESMVSAYDLEKGMTVQAYLDRSCRVLRAIAFGCEP